jgi:serine/threonine-protein kinase RsbW
MATYSFRYPSRLESEEQMLDDFESALKNSGVELKTCRGFLLAVSEAFNNAMVHGNGSDPTKQVSVRLEVNEKFITADILDEGESGLDRLRARKPRGLLAEGGRGIDLIDHYADSVEYSQHTTGGLSVSISIERKIVRETI